MIIENENGGPENWEKHVTALDYICIVLAAR